MQSIHQTTMLAMLNAGDPVSIDFWAKDGRIIHMDNAISLRYNFHSGTRQIKNLNSLQIRQVRDCLIFRVNGLEVFL